MPGLSKKKLQAEIKKAVPTVLPLLPALWTGYAVCSQRIDDNIAKTIVVVLLCLFYRAALLKHRQTAVRLHVPEHIVLLYFACGLEMIKYPHYIFSALGSKVQLFKFGLAVIGYWIFAAAALEWFLDWLYRYSAGKQTKNTPAAYRPAAVQKWTTGILFVLGLPYLYAFYPGGVFSDMFAQINSYYTGVITNHHPVLTTYLNGFLVRLGSHISDNFGVFLGNFLQYLLFCLAVGCLMGMLYRLTQSRAAVLVCLLFYALVPAFYHFSYLLVKVSIYSPLFVLYCCLMIQLLLEARLGRREWVLFAVLSVLLLLVRREGVYVLLLSTAGLLCAFLRDAKNRKHLLVIMALVLCVHVGYHRVFLPALHISEATTGEIYSIPFLQTSLYIREAYDDITDEETRALQTVFGEDLEEVGKRYDPTITDDMRSLFRYGLDSEAYSRYISAWLSMGLRHPKFYAQALLEHISAYVLPEGYKSWYIYPELDVLEDEWKSPYLELSNSRAPGAAVMRQLYHQYTAAWEKLPLFALTTAPGAYTWVYLLLLVLLLRLPDKKHLAAFVPILCVLGVCCVGPVNGYTRYFIPAETALPLYIGYTLKLYALYAGPAKPARPVKINARRRSAIADFK